MLNNRNKIENLQNKVEEVKAQQGTLTATLEKILTSQNELKIMLSEVEKDVMKQASTIKHDAELKEKKLIILLKILMIV